MTEVTQTEAQPEQANNLSELSTDSKNMAVLSNVLTIFFGFIPCLIFFLVKSEDKFIRHHACEGLNFCLSIFIYALALGLISIIPLLGWIVSGLGFLAILLGWYILLIIATVKASKGEEYKYPFILRLVK